METRGAKKGREITWDVGRKKADPGMESKKISVALPAKMWTELTEKAEKQGITRNKLIRNILEIYLKR